MSVANEQQVYALLESLSIPYDKIEHPPVYTGEEAAVYDEGYDAAHIKNLFLVNADKSKYFLVMLEVAKKLKARELARAIGEKGLTFALPEELLRLLGVTPGAVSPFGLINEGAGDVVAIMDKHIASFSRVNFHPNVNTASIILETEDFFKVLKHFGNRIIMLDL